MFIIAPGNKSFQTKVSRQIFCKSKFEKRSWCFLENKIELWV